MKSKVQSIRISQPVRLIGALVAMLLLLAACAPASISAAAPTATQASAATATVAPSETPAPSATVATAEAEVDVADNPALGKILVGANGMTLYMFTKDGPNQSNCNAACLAKWPPLLSQGSPIAGAGVDASMLGTASLADGSKIVTYNKMPLYYFAADKAAGDTNGQNVGSVWFVVSPDGKAVGMEPAATEAATEAATATVAASASNEAELSVVNNPTLGQILVGANGMTLYIFTKDGPNQSNCNAACLANWPPLITEGSPKLGAGVDDSKVGTATLADGRKIVTYNQMPLYYYAGDKAAGDTTGQGVGSVWYAISPDGKVVGSGSGYNY